MMQKNLVSVALTVILSTLMFTATAGTSQFSISKPVSETNKDQQLNGYSLHYNTTEPDNYNTCSDGVNKCTPIMKGISLRPCFCPAK